MSFTIGSLFDGSGGFPLSAFMCGGVPVWASEIEPYPIAVTTSRFPYMKHIGSVTDVNGANVEPVDVITFGSPCQDLSVAGKRAGLKHEDNGDDETTRSGLFMEAVRIIKEMREKTNGEYPKFAVWENVPGAFSSNKGEDFRIVLEELIKIVEPSAVMPDVPKFGWAYADSYSGNGWSIAYRVLDAQYWGVAQRRRRIYLVLDLRGQCARKVLFEREGLRGYFTEGRTPWQTTPTDVERSVGADDREGDIPYTLKIRSGVSVDSYGKAAGKGALIQKNLSATLGVSQDQYLFQPIGVDIYNLALTEDKACSLTAGGYGSTGTSPKVMIPVCYGIGAYDSNAMKSDNPHSGIYEADTSRTLDVNGGNPACNQGGIAIVQGDVYAVDQGGGKSQANVSENLSPTLTCTHGGEPAVCLGIGIQSSQGVDKIGEDLSPCLINGSNPGWQNGVAYAECLETFHCTTEENKTQPLKARDYKDPLTVVYSDTSPKYIVRRLTPTECARLQGFPDRWADIDKKTEFTDEEYQFWLNVRNTHAEINGKQVKEYDKKQMLTWYNKLHNDSAEYKLWGNGIALPCALYVMQGIAEIVEQH